MMTESIHQEDIMILNMYMPNDKFEKYEAKLIDQKGQIHKSTVRDFNTFLSVNDELIDKKSVKI